MGILNFVSWETGGTEEVQSQTGTAATQNTTVNTGTYALRTNPTGTAVGNHRIAGLRADGRADNALGVSTLYTKFDFRVATAPASAEEDFYAVLDTGASFKCVFRLNSARQIVAYNNAGGLVATGSTALALNSWYRLEFRTSTGSGSTSYEVKIDGVTELSGTMDQLTNAHGSIRLGKAADQNGNSVSYFFDNCVLSDSAFPGAMKVLRLAPDGNGSTASWTNGTGASDYTQVDEVPTSDADYIQCAAAAGDKVHLVTLESCSSAGMPSGATINAFKAFARLRENSSGSSAFKVRIRSGSTNSDGSTFNGSTTLTNHFRILETDPNTGSAWTESGVDAVEVGVVETANIATRCTAICGFVLYTEAANQDATGTASQTAPSAGQVGAGTEIIAGTASQNATHAAQAASGVEAVSGAAVQASSIAGQAASGLETFTGTVAQATASAQQSASGLEIVTGSAAQAARAAAQSSAGVVANPVTGTAGQVAPSSAQAASGSEAFLGVAVQTLPGASQGASGAVGAEPVSGTAVQTAPAAEQAASGVETFAGSSAQTAEGTSQAATGLETFVGAASQSAPAAQQAASGTEAVTGAAASTAPVAGQAASGDVAFEGASGSITQTAPRSAQAGSGVEAILGAAAATGRAAAQAASGHMAPSGAAVQAMASARQSASGLEAFTGTAASTAPVGGQAAAGLETIVGTATGVAPLVGQQALAGGVSPGGIIVQTAALAGQAAVGVNDSFDVVTPAPGWLTIGTTGPGSDVPGGAPVSAAPAGALGGAVTAGSVHGSGGIGVKIRTTVKG